MLFLWPARLVSCEAGDLLDFGSKSIKSPIGLGVI
jgi:hypothetical protein